MISRRSLFNAIASIVAVATGRARAEPRPYGFESFKAPEGLSYQWIAETVKGEPQTETMAQMFRAGWVPVPANQWSDIFDIKGDEIRKGGQLLVQRPLALTEAAMAAEVDAVQEQVRKLEAKFGSYVETVGGKSTGFEVRRRDLNEPREPSPRFRRLKNEDELQAWLEKGNDDGGTG